MDRLRLNVDECALLIIDLQEKLMAAMKDREKVYRNTKLLLTISREFNIPVIVTEQYPRGLGFTAPEIKQNLNEINYLEKVHFSACNQEMQEILGRVNKKTIIIVGSETHVCVFQTTRDLIDWGYNVHVVRDAACSRFDENHHNGLALMKDAGAVITNTETVLFDLLKVAGTPQFKIISALLK